MKKGLKYLLIVVAAAFLALVLREIIVLMF